jgi:triphosphoribosyl-dephospho-CoA synthase
LRRQPKPEAISRGFLDACLAELDALKPGNVHRLAAGHNMTVDDFVASAEAAAPIMGEQRLGVGERVRRAVEATRKAVGQNTNLGIVLLAAPLANAALMPGAGNLERRLRLILQGLSVDDAREAYRAIRETRPGGLGEAPEHDIAAEPRVTLLEAMRAAELRDRIAWNYAHGFADIFTLGLKWLAHARERWDEPAFASPSWAVTRVYLGFLAHLPDTLIERKFGTRMATEVREEAGPIETSFTACASPEAMTAPLAAFDKALKQRGLNPGTSADLTVATLFAAALTALDSAE